MLDSQSISYHMVAIVWAFSFVSLGSAQRCRMGKRGLCALPQIRLTLGPAPMARHGFSFFGGRNDKRWRSAIKDFLL